MLWVCLCGVCLAWTYLTSMADESAGATLLAYLPRWPWALPFLWAAMVMRKPPRVERLPLIAGLAVVFGPVMGLSAPIGFPLRAAAAPKAFSTPPTAAEPIHLRVMTLNLGSRLADSTAFAALVDRVEPDVVLLQECNDRADVAFAGAWHYRDDDALCIASRFPIQAAVVQYRPIAPKNDAYIARYRLALPALALDVVNLHLDTPREAFESVMERGDLSQVGPVLSRRSQQVRLARAWVERHVDVERVVVAGDFNLTVDSPLYRQAWGDLPNAFSERGWGWGFTKRAGVFAVRIDHVLVGRDWRVDASWIDSAVGSDHRPLVADLALPAP